MHTLPLLIKDIVVGPALPPEVCDGSQLQQHQASVIERRAPCWFYRSEKLSDVKHTRFLEELAIFAQTLFSWKTHVFMGHMGLHSAPCGSVVTMWVMWSTRRHFEPVGASQLLFLL